MDNGNGALMRIFPFSMYCIEKELSQSEALSVIQNAAGLTHAHEINVMSCFVYTLVLDECIRTRNAILAYQNAVLRDASFFNRVFSNNTVMAHDVLFQLAEESFDPDSIPQSGYVVDSLAIALYSLLRTNRFEDAIKMAIHFGYDTDTNAAITGSIAGAMYGQSQIPQRWLNKLRKKELLLKIGQQFSKSIAISSKDS